MELDIPSDVLSRELNGEAVLLDLRSGRYYGLNATGAVIWAGLLDGLDRDRIAERLVEAFEVEPAPALADTDAFVTMLLDAGLVSRQRSTV